MSEHVTKSDISNIKELFNSRFDALSEQIKNDKENMRQVFLTKEEFNARLNQNRRWLLGFSISFIGTFIGIFFFIFEGWISNTVEKTIIDNEHIENIVTNAIVEEFKDLVITEY